MATSLLLADDSPTIAKILGMALQAEDYEIRSVLTAEEALKELEKSPPAFFLVDLDLPGKNGYDFARHIRSLPALAATRVLLLSSAFEPVDEQELASSGADGVLAKPFDPADLRAKLKEIAAAPPKAPDAPSALDLLSGGEAPTGDADAILSSLLGGSGDTPPPAPPLASLSPDLPPPAPGEGSELLQEPTTLIDLGEMGEAEATPPVLDLSQSFQTPPGGTALIDFSALTRETAAPPPPPSEPTPAEALVAPAPAPDEPLSANAAALAAFFAAEIEAKEKQPAAEPEDDSFDASLSSIDWGKAPAPAGLDAWTNPAPPPADAPKAAPAQQRAASALPSSAGSGASSGGSFLFDTGGSTFRFAEDYVQRITRSFTGEGQEMTIPRPQAEPGVFPRASDDRPAAAAAPGAPASVRAPLPGGSSAASGGAWSPEEVERIEQLVREEVQMVVREVTEKVIWEVVPELAEKLIRKELEKVLREIDDQST